MVPVDIKTDARVILIIVLLDAVAAGVWFKVVATETCFVEPIKTVVETLLPTDILLEITKTLVVVLEVNFGDVEVVELITDVDVMEIGCWEDIIEEIEKEIDDDVVEIVVDVLELEWTEIMVDVNDVEEAVVCSNNDKPEKEIVVVVVYVAKGSNITTFLEDEVDVCDGDINRSDESAVGVEKLVVVSVNNSWEVTAEMVLEGKEVDCVWTLSLSTWPLEDGIGGAVEDVVIGIVEYGDTMILEGGGKVFTEDEDIIIKEVDTDSGGVEIIMLEVDEEEEEEEEEVGMTIEEAIWVGYFEIVFGKMRLADVDVVDVGKDWRVLGENSVDFL